ncbi:MAG: tetratricopeptide repeat protein [candidate division KSB1 bacterium]|nr:tetratricopeptide repeat protein [candidate division KSB1 bacterium]
MDRKTQAEKMMQRFTVIFIFTFLLSGAVWSEQTNGGAKGPVEEVYQVTSHPEADLAPRVSTDGKWLAYVNRQSGNYDIYIKNLQTGRSRRLTDHEADDYHPVWDKKNRYLIFVSQRSDAKGDLFRLNLRNVRGELIAKGKPERLTTYMGFDGLPTISEYDEHIAWVSDRTGRPEIWLMTKRGQAIRQLTHGGATHPAWSPKQSYLAFTSFRQDGSNGDIWLINLYAPREWIEVRTPLDSLERPMWPVTRGEAADGFPTWSPDAKTILFCRSDHDDNGDGLITPSDRSVIWAVDVSHLPQDHPSSLNPSYRLYRETFDERIVHRACPIVSAKYNAAQPEYGMDGRIYFSSEIKGNFDIFSLPDSLLHGHPPSIDDMPPLPNGLAAKDLSIFIDEPPVWNERQRRQLYDRIYTLQRIMDSPQADAEQIAGAAYEIAVCSLLLGDSLRCVRHLDFILADYPASEAAPFAELLRTRVSEVRKENEAQKLRLLEQEILRLQAGAAPSRRFAAESELLLGALYERQERFEDAEKAYRRETEKAQAFPDLVGEALLRLGRLQKTEGKYGDAMASFLSAMKNGGKPEKHAQARSELLEMFTLGAADDATLLSRYKMVIRRFFALDVFVIEPFLRIAELHVRNGRLQEALDLYDFLQAQFADLTDEAFDIRLGRAQVLYRLGDLQQAATLLSETAALYRQNRPKLAKQAETQLTDMLYHSALDLMTTNQYGQAAARLKKVLEIDPHHLPAHQSYIECAFLLNQIDQVLTEYTEAVRNHPEDNILLYAQGLAYSYKGASIYPNGCETWVTSAEALEQSNQILYKALALDYNLIDAYLLLSFNSELLESFQNRRQREAKSFAQKAFGTITAPLVWLYHTVTFYEETKPPRYYESAIQELTQAMALNDEELYPRREALLALNMANNYYSLGEFGFRKAYEYYHTFLKYDSTFAGMPHEALIKERMGHCAIFVNDQLRGPNYLKRAIELYGKLNNQERLLLNLKRLALLYEVGENHSEALRYYSAAAEMEERLGRYDGLLRSRRSAALHYYALGRYEEAVRSAEEALSMLESGQVPRKKSKPIYLQIGLLDLYAPIPFDLRKVGAKSTIDISTEEEEAFLYTILAKVFIENKDFDRAIEFYQKKFDLYERRHDYDAQAVFQNNMGYLYFLKGDYDNAWRMFTNSYWWCVRTKYVYGQLLNLENAAQVVLTIANEEDPKRKVNFAKYHRWIIGKLTDLLRVTRGDEAFYSAIHARYRLLLADLLIVPYAELPKNLEARWSFLEAVGNAEKHLMEAERLSRQYRLPREECAALYRRAELRLQTGDSTAVSLYLRAKETAEQHQLRDLLRQIYTALGSESMRLSERTDNSLADASFYLQEAVRLTEREAPSNLLLSAVQVRRLIEAPYRRLIQLQAERGDAENALLTAERMRSQVFRQLMRRDRPSLGGETEQRLFHRADSLAEELRRQTEQANRTRTNDAVLAEEIERLQREYEAALTVVRRKAPQLEPFLRPVNISLAELQSRLEPKEGLLTILYLQDQLLFGWITRRNIELYRPNLAASNFRKLLVRLRDGFEADSLDAAAADSIKTAFSILPLQGIKRLYILPEHKDLPFPWSALFHLVDFPTVAGVISDLSAFFPPGKTDRLPSLTILSSDSLLLQALQKRDSLVVSPLPSKASDRIDAAVVHLRGNSLAQPVFPTNSTFSAAWAGKWSPLDLLRGKASLTLLCLDIDKGEWTAEALSAWERAAYFNGTRRLFVSLWPTADSSRTFLQSCFRYLQNNLPSAALDTTQEQMVEKGVPLRFWAGFQIYGVESGSTAEAPMSSDADEWVARGDEARRARNWRHAVECYLEALERTQAEREKNESIAERLLASALSGGLWTEAVDVVRRRASYYSQKNLRREQAAMQRLMAVVYHQQGATAGEAQALAEYRRLCRTFSIPYDDATAFFETAQLYADNGDYEQAALLSIKAAERYGKLNRTRNQIESLLRAAEYLFEETGYVDLAIDLAESAEQLSKNNQQMDLQARALTFLGRCRFGVDANKARQSLQSALKLAEKGGFKRLAAEIRLSMAELHLRTFEPMAAERFLVQIEVAELDPALKIAHHLLIARQARAVGDTAKAAALLRKAFLEAEWSDDADLEQRVGEAVAVHAALSGKAAKAAEEMKRSVRLESRPFNRSAIRRRTALALFLYLAGKTEEAKSEAKENIGACDRPYLYDFRSANNWLLSCLEEDAALSRQFAEAAASAAQRIGRSDLLFRAYYRLAQLAEEDDRAHFYLVAADSALSLAPPQSEYDDYFLGLLPLERRFYQTAVKLCVRSNRLHDALVFADQHRNIDFIHAARLRLFSFKADDRQQAEHYFRIKERLSRLYSSAMFQCDPRSIFAAKDSLIVKRQISALQDSLRSLKETCRFQDPQLGPLLFGLSGCREASPLADGRLLISLYHDDETLYIWRRREDRLDVDLQPYDAVQTKNVLKTLQQLDLNADAGDFTRLLYATVFEPWQQDVEQARRIVIVPYSQWHYVPWAMLNDKSGTFLGLEKPISLAAWSFEAEKKESLTAAWNSKRLILVGKPPSSQQDPFYKPLARALERYAEESIVLLPDRLQTASLGGSVLVAESLDENSQEAWLYQPESESGYRNMAWPDWMQQSEPPYAVVFLRTRNSEPQEGTETAVAGAVASYLGSALLLPLPLNADAFAAAILVKRYVKMLSEGLSPSEALNSAQRAVYDRLDRRPKAWGCFVLYDVGR